jgi:hypothetical protein
MSESVDEGIVSETRLMEQLTAAGFDPAAVVRQLAPLVLGIAVCRMCGCTDVYGCDEGCYWIEDNLCSACVAEVGQE